MSTKPLEGIRIVEVTQWVAAPAATAMLADWGADVIHVEHPERGDGMRGVVSVGGMLATSFDWLFENTNRNKKSITLDISKEQGQDILHRLIKGCDVFVSTLRPSELKRYDLEYQRLSRDNPKLISANLTGYGRIGPLNELRGFDWTAFWARAGFMATVKEPDGPPVFPRGGMGDHTTALALASGITTALFTRERTGMGQEIDVSLYGTGIFVLSIDYMCAMALDGIYPPTRHRKDGIAMTNAYLTKDDKWIFFVHMQQDPYWPGFCRALGLEHLENDERFSAYEARAENGHELTTLVEEAVATRTLEEWLPLLDENQLIYAPVLEPSDVIHDEQALANEYFIKVKHPMHGTIRFISNPVKLSRTPAEVREPAPQMGQHTEEVLLDNGYTWEDIARLKDDGVIG